MAISVTLCNLALGEIRAPEILDPTEDTKEAIECRRYYPQCLSVLLERLDWSFATKVATLAELSVNPRASEWLHAYTLPTDCATPKRLVPPVSGSIVAYCGWVGGFEPTFIVEAGILYSNVPDAILEYSANEIEEAQMSALFKDALTYALAARLAVPLRDSRETKGELLNQAEIAAQRAEADDFNRQPQRQVDEIDEVALARAGGVTSCGWGSA